MAQKYSMLPSQVLEHATTFDIQMHIIAESYKEQQMKKASGKSIAPDMSSEQLTEAYSKWREQST